MTGPCRSCIDGLSDLGDECPVCDGRGYFDDEADGRCVHCGADVDHYHGCPDDPAPDYDDPFYATISSDYAIAPNRIEGDA